MPNTITFFFSDYYYKSLKIPKGKSEAVNRRTNNTMVKKK